MQCKYTRNVPLVFYVYFLDAFYFVVYCWEQFVQYFEGDVPAVLIQWVDLL